MAFRYLGKDAAYLVRNYLNGDLERFLKWIRPPWLAAHAITVR